MDWWGKLLAWLEPWLAYLLGLMEGGSLLGLAAAVVAGVLLGLTPVSYLLMPAVVGYAGSGKSPDRRRAAALSLAFVLGLITVYAAIGALWGTVGWHLVDLIERSLWLWYGIGAAALLLMGLRMVGLLRLGWPRAVLPTPPDPAAGWQRGVLGAYLLGLPFGLVAGCPGREPVRLAVLTAVAATTQPLMGALAMLALGLGQGLILVAVGTCGATLPGLKGVARHRVAVNRLLGLLLLATAAYLGWLASGYLPAR
jgi:cytochrome c biogenesis protein CcdA